jgi:two-component system sensor histidine kinase DevS
MYDFVEERARDGILHGEMEHLQGIELTDDVVWAVIEAAPDAVLLVDSDGRIALANRQVETLFGYDRVELVGAAVEVLVPDDVREMHVDLRRRYQANPVTRPMGVGRELLGRRRDGSLLPVEISLSPVSAADEVLTIAVVRDVTERVQAQEQLLDAGRQLALLEDRERIARDLHDRVIQRLFATGLALQALATTTDDDALSTRLERAVDEVDESIRDLRTVIFGLARRTTRKSLRDEILALVTESSRALTFEPRVRFSGPIDTTVPKELWEHVIAALREMLSNIAKHAHATDVEIEVHAGDTLRLNVRDNGVGLPATRSGEGQGLRNLASRAESLGGGFAIEAAEPRGTVVHWEASLTPPR